MSPKKLRIAEIVNGRAAMLGSSLLIIAVMAGRINEILVDKSFDVHSIWMAIGVYAS